ncbi:hypothetical protein IMSAG025_00338 [Muribaculaceae bacterium]|nr:hypothetical protein IMSAG025_00338 [Muribaculaceae bacterium]
MLQAWQAFYPAHLTDSDMPVSRVTIALERSVEAFDMLLEDFGRAGTVIIEEVYKPGCHADEHPDVALFDLPARGSGHLQPHFLIGLVTTDIIVFDNCRPESLVQILQMNPYLADQFLCRAFVKVEAVGTEVFDCIFKWHAVEIAKLGESGNEGGCILRVQQRRGGSGAFVYFLVLHIFAYLVDYFLEAHRLHDIAHNIAFAYERCRLGVEVGAVRLHHNRLYLALGMGLSPGSIVGAFLLWPLFRSF